MISAGGQTERTETAELKRAEIVGEAARLFNEKGYHRTSMDDIASTVGIRKPTLYHYFRRKDEILFWIHEDVIDLIIERHQAREQMKMPVDHRLLEIIADVLELMETRPGHARVFFEHIRELPLEQQKIVNEKRHRYSDIVEGLIRDGVESGVFRAETDVRFAALSIMGSCNWAYQWFRPDGPLRSRQVAYAFWDMAMRGLAAGDGR